MEFTITNLDKVHSQNDLFTVYCPNGVQDPVTNRSTYGWDCVMIPNRGAMYSATANLSYEHYFIYNPETNNVQYVKYGSVHIDSAGATTNDHVIVTIRENLEGINSQCTYRCPVKFANNKKVTFEMLTKTYAVTNSRRELVVGNGECIVKKCVYFNYDHVEQFHYCHVIAGTTIARVIPKNRITHLTFPDHTQKANVTCHLSPDGLQVKLRGILCCDGELDIHVDMNHHQNFRYNQNELSFIGDHSGLSIVSYKRTSSGRGRIILRHVHPANFEFTLVNL